MAALRDPRSGCPWDLQQDFASIAPHTLEEAYEVVDAIEREHWSDLRDELGDLLFQVVFLAQLASEQAAFDFAAVVEAIATKLVRRHPHVFNRTSGDVTDAAAVSEQWEAIKATERAGRDQRGELSDIPQALPALTRAAKLGQRAGRVGLDWPDAAAVRRQLEAELDELDAELAAGAPSAERVADECGDVLFSMAQYCRRLGVAPEAALRGANRKFQRRFESIEAGLRREGCRPEDLSAADWDRRWRAAKALESQSG